MHRKLDANAHETRGMPATQNICACSASPSAHFARKNSNIGASECTIEG